MEHLAQKALAASKRSPMHVVADFSGHAPCGFTCCGELLTGEMLPLKVGEEVWVGRRHGDWMHGRLSNESGDAACLPAGLQVEGWFPRSCVQRKRKTASARNRSPWLRLLQGTWQRELGANIHVHGLLVAVEGALADGHPPFTLHLRHLDHGCDGVAAATIFLQGCSLLACDELEARWSCGDVWRRLSSEDHSLSASASSSSSSSSSAEEKEEVAFVGEGKKSSEELFNRDLNGISLDAYVEQHGQAVVNFYLPDKDARNDIGVEFLELEARLRERASTTRLGKVDMAVNSKLASRFGFQAYPTVSYLKWIDGKMVRLDYGGMFFASQLLAWIEELEHVAFDWDTVANPGTVYLTQDNFTSFVSSNKRVLVKFFIPTCIRCAAYAPAFDGIARRMARADAKTQLAKVDALADRDLAERYAVTSYPSLKYFVDAKEAEETVPYRHLADWLLRHEEKVPDAKRLEALFDARAGCELSVIAVLDKASKSRRKLMREIAADAREVAPEVCVGLEAVRKCSSERAAQAAPESDKADCDNLGEHLKIQRGAAKQGGEVVFDGKWTVKDVTAWILRQSLEGIGDYDLDSRKYTPSKRSQDYLRTVLVYSSPYRDSPCALDPRKPAQEVRDFMLALTSNKSSEKVACSCAGPAASASERDDALALQNATSTSSQVTLLSWSAKLGMKRYVLKDLDRMDKPVTALEQFVEQFRKGSLQPFYKSQPWRTTSADADCLTTLVGDTFEEVAFAQDKDVLVKFYAPWCPQCQKLDPIWRELARSVCKAGYQHRGVVIVEADATENEFVEAVSSYPHIVLYPAMPGSVEEQMAARIQYKSMSWKADTLLDFLESNAVNLNSDTRSKRRKERRRRGSKQTKSSIPSEL
eukprot:TRINITY_DN24769_c0_g1_i1.p1 TRINITY_DN24769_c0_g1~~TRINITY_DN24769_c0_g1_i1.p1  ORF type:complete len:873 (-),score=203.76 TRINITY_DN24769_c0_g1_i1:60-2678(-)